MKVLRTGTAGGNKLVGRVECTLCESELELIVSDLRLVTEEYAKVCNLPVDTAFFVCPVCSTAQPHDFDTVTLMRVQKCQALQAKVKQAQQDALNAD